MKSLVLGATGHIGAHVVRALLAEGHAVRAAYRRKQYLTVLEGLPVERVQVDLDSLDGLPEALHGCEWVFHAAPYYPRFQDRRGPALAKGIASTQRVLAAIAEAKPSRVVLTSSAATIQRVPGRDATEQDAESWPLIHWRPLYATVKIAIEQEVLRAVDAGLPAVIVNPSLCIGEYDAHPFSGRAVLVFAKHRVPFYLDHRFNVIYTGDVGIGHVRAAQRGRIGQRYLLSCRNVTLLEFARMVAKAAAVPAPRWRVPYGMALAIANVSEGLAWVTRTEPILPLAAVHTTRLGQRLDAGKAVNELGLPQTPIEEAIRRAVGWFREHDYL
jgi:dihydroflavonol-4-reductase